MDQYHYLFKYLLVGDSAVGKSCITENFTKNQFRQDHDPTIGVEFGTRLVEITGKSIKLQIWDTVLIYISKAGLETFRSITRSYYRGSIAVFLVFDITKKSIMDYIDRWYNEIKNNVSEFSRLILIGNKSDLEQEQNIVLCSRQVTREEAEKLAQKYKMPYYETSAKTGQNIIQIFEEVTLGILKEIEAKIIDPTQQFNGIKVGVIQKKEKQQDVSKE